jgi:hypothetical protein
MAANGLSTPEVARQPIKPNVHDRSGVKSEQLADQQPSNDANAERLT